MNSICVSAFGASYTYQRPFDAAPITITAIPEDPATLMEANPAGYLVLWVALNDWVGDAPANGDTVTIGEDVWTLVENRTDGENGARLIFSRTYNSQG